MWTTAKDGMDLTNPTSTKHISHHYGRKRAQNIWKHCISKNCTNESICRCKTNTQMSSSVDSIDEPSNNH